MKAKPRKPVCKVTKARTRKPAPQPVAGKSSTPPRYLLRTTAANGISGGQTLDDDTTAPAIEWPTEPGSVVACVDWDPKPDCGHGIHGYLYGEGNGSQLSRAADAIWQVVEVLDGDVVVRIDTTDLKVKSPRVTLRYSGAKDAAIDWLIARAPGHATFGAKATAGYAGTATAGYAGTATAGDEGELRIRYWDGQRYRCCIGYVGEGIDANVPHVVRDGKLVRKDAVV